MNNKAAPNNLRVSQEAAADRSTDKQDIIMQHLEDHKIALQFISERNLVEEYLSFKSAVKGGANLPTEAVTMEATVGAQA